MSEWKLKRFWTSAASAEAEGGFRVELDGRPVKTPAKQTLIVPTKALADTLAAEWDAQDGEINPADMPLTKLANSALDKVTAQHGEVADMIAEYGGSDLLCYRAEGPNALVAREKEIWTPYLEWAQTNHAIRLQVQTGIMPVLQAEDSMTRIRKLTHDMGAFELTGFHEMVTITGSWVLGFATFQTAFPVESIWQASVLDEVFQAEQWGEDEEALEFREKKRAAFEIAHQFVAAVRV